MHKSSYELMGELLGRLIVKGVIGPALSARTGQRSEGTVLDCGSAIAGTGMQSSYRDLMPPLVDYTGLDVSAGKNVDAVSDLCSLDPATWFRGVWDVVISGQMLEHIEFPLLAAQRMKEYVRTGGWIILIAPWQYGIHRYPLDCWRVLPDGMAWLLEGFEEVETGIRGNDCFGIGKKPQDYRAPWNISRS